MATRASPPLSGGDAHPGRLLLAGLAASLGVGAAQGESWTIVPEVTVSETYSTNMAMTAAAPQSGWITNIVPGIRIDGGGARVKGHLDYRINNLYYRDRSDLNRHQNLLNSNARVEAVDNFLFVDASANITQRNTSVFSPMAVDQGNATRYQTETTTLQLSPYIRGRISNAADYLLRWNVIDSRSDDPTLASTRVNQLAGTVKNQATAGKIGWFADIDATAVRNDVIGDRENIRWRGGVIFPLRDRLHMSLSMGQERTDYANTDKDTVSTPGLGVEWTPSPRTQVAALAERRFFGTGRNIVVTHRTPLTAWRYSDMKDVAILPTLLAGFRPGSIYELMSDLLTTSIPDPVARAQAVRTRMDQLSPVASLADAGGVQTSRFYLDHVRHASVAVLGVRNTLTLVLTQRNQQLLSFTPGVIDNFSQSSEIRERGGSLSWLLKLTPVTNLNVATARVKYEGVSVSGLATTQNSTTAVLSHRLSPKTSASLGARRTHFDNTAATAFHENAVVGSLTHRF